MPQYKGTHLTGVYIHTIIRTVYSASYYILTDTPKSGEVEHQIAPKLDVANMASTASAQLGRYPE